jgi:GWxTD domain-containing protein
MLEVFRFGMPARHTFSVEVSVNSKDKPKEKHVKTLKVSALDAALTSDLILAKQVGLVTDSTPASQWTIHVGGVGLLTASEIILEPGKESVGYYVELYARHGKPLSGTVWGVVQRREDGLQFARFPLQRLDTVQAFTPIAGTTNLAGLAPGKYNFEVQLALQDTTITLVHPFEMLAAAAAPASTAGTASSGFFSTVSDADMDGKYSAAAVWLTEKAQSEVFKQLTAAGKREYLNKMFGSEMPTPNDGKETSSIDAFVTRANVVDQRYSEKQGRGKQDGWTTDRGRIYMLHGEPNNIVSKPAPQNGSPYEIFFYQTGKGLAYLFGDDSRTGHYRLTWTNDTNQTGISSLSRVGQEALQDLQRLGIHIGN